MGAPDRRRPLYFAASSGRLGPRCSLSHRAQGQESRRGRDQIRARGCVAGEDSAGALASGHGAVPSSSGATFRGGSMAVRRAGLSVCRDGIWRPDARRDPSSAGAERGRNIGVIAARSGRADVSASAATDSWPAAAVESPGRRGSAQTGQRYDSPRRPWRLDRRRCLEPRRDAGRGAFPAGVNGGRSLI
jgi:hypothetical protein